MGRAFAIAIVLNLAFVGIEFFYGFLANSTALMATPATTCPTCWA